MTKLEQLHGIRSLADVTNFASANGISVPSEHTKFSAIKNYLISILENNNNNLQVVNWQKKYKVLDIRLRWTASRENNGKPYLIIKIGGTKGPVKKSFWCKERDEDTGSIVSDSANQIRESSWIGPIFISEVRKKASAMGIAKLLFLNNNKIDEHVLSAMFNGWFTFKCDVYHAGDNIPGTENAPKSYEHDGQQFHIVDGVCNADDVAFAVELIRKNKNDNK